MVDSAPHQGAVDNPLPNPSAVFEQYSSGIYDCERFIAESTDYTVDTDSAIGMSTTLMMLKMKEVLSSKGTGIARKLRAGVFDEEALQHLMTQRVVTNMYLHQISVQGGARLAGPLDHLLKSEVGLQKAAGPSLPLALSLAPLSLEDPPPPPQRVHRRVDHRPLSDNCQKARRR